MILRHSPQDPFQKELIVVHKLSGSRFGVVFCPHLEVGRSLFVQATQALRLKLAADFLLLAKETLGFALKGACNRGELSVQIID